MNALPFIYSHPGLEAKKSPKDGHVESFGQEQPQLWWSHIIELALLRNLASPISKHCLLINPHIKTSNYEKVVETVALYVLY